MKNLPIQFADWQTASILQADKAPAAVGPSAGSGLEAGSFDAYVLYLQTQEDIAQFELLAALRHYRGTSKQKADRIQMARIRCEQLQAALAACDEYQLLGDA